jgi:hypothetical protein
MLLLQPLVLLLLMMLRLSPCICACGPRRCSLPLIFFRSRLDASQSLSSPRYESASNFGGVAALDQQCLRRRVQTQVFLSHL